MELWGTTLSIRTFRNPWDKYHIRKTKFPELLKRNPEKKHKFGLSWPLRTLWGEIWTTESLGQSIMCDITLQIERTGEG